MSGVLTEADSAVASRPDRPVSRQWSGTSFERNNRSTIASFNPEADLLTGFGVAAIDSVQGPQTASASPLGVASNVPPGLVNLKQTPLGQTQGKEVRQYIIQFKNSVDNVAEQANRLVRRYHGQLSQVYDNSLKGFAAQLPVSAIRRLKQQNTIAAIYEDVPVQLAPSLTKAGQAQNSLRNRVIAQSTQSTPWGVNRVGGSNDGTGKTVWVIDTGVDYRHPDLRVDTRRAKTFVGRSATDDNGHGTHVAGTIAALNNTVGVVGVAAGATVVPVKVLDRNGSGYLSNVIAGVDHVARYGKPGEVVNMSLGGGYYQPLNDAVLRAAAKGIKFAIAAGNEARDIVTTSPASTNGVNVFTVSAIDSTDTLASFSNFGFGVDYAAPGVGVLSTWLGGSYASLSGTSMATPHVAGLLLRGTPGVNGIVKGDRDTFNEGIAFGIV